MEFALCLNGEFVVGLLGFWMIWGNVELLPWQTGAAQGAAAYGCGKSHSWCLNSGQICQLKIHFVGRFVITFYFVWHALLSENILAITQKVVNPQNNTGGGNRVCSLFDVFHFSWVG